MVEFAADALKARGQPGADALRAARPALREMLPVWAGGIGFKADSFRQAFFGTDAHPVDAYRLQRVTLAVMRGDDYAGLKDAARELADAVQGIGAARLPGVLAEARAQLVPVPAGKARSAPAAADAGVVKIAAPSAAPAPGVAFPAIGPVLRGVGTVLGSSAATAGAAVAGAAAVLLWPKSLTEPVPGPADRI